jgi:hypothetical protein
MRTAHRRLAQRGEVGNMAVVCMDRLGRVGGAANHDGFSYCTASQGVVPQQIKVVKVQ